MRAIAVSVLIPVYHGDHPGHLQEALDSVFLQTRPAAQVVLVKDGPLTASLDAVIAAYAQPSLKVVAREKNGGLTAALNTGIAACDFPWIARMDADDRCAPDRLEKQLTYLEQHPEVVLIGSWIDEYDETIEKKFGTRTLPEHHADILNYAKWRCPFNHMTVIYKKEVVEALGCYEDFGAVGDDYVLWVKFLQAGHVTANFPEVLVDARGGKAFFSKRRRGWNYLKHELAEVRRFYQMGFISWYHVIVHAAVKTITRLSPNGVVKGIYRMLRK